MGLRPQHNMAADYPTTILFESIEHTKTSTYRTFLCPSTISRPIKTARLIRGRRMPYNVQKETSIAPVMREPMGSHSACQMWGDERMRCNTQREQDDDINDDPLLDEFRLLRRRLFHWQGEQQPRIVASHVVVWETRWSLQSDHESTVVSAPTQMQRHKLPQAAGCQNNFSIGRLTVSCRLGICRPAYILGAFPGGDSVF